MKIYQWDEISGEIHDVTWRMYEIAFSWEGWRSGFVSGTGRGC